MHDLKDENNVGKSSFSVIKKAILYIIGGGILVLVFLGLYGTYYNDVIEYLRERRAEDFLDKMMREEELAEQAMKEDKYGGKTPEETLSMLIEALEAGDVELASRYYSPSIQEDKVLNYQKRINEEGGLGSLIDYFHGVMVNGIKKCIDSEVINGCVIDYEYTTEEEKFYVVQGRNENIIVPKGNKDIDSVSFELNPFTNVWKISR